MPVYKQQDYMEEKAAESGDLYVIFDIVFPAKISAEHKEKITAILAGAKWAVVWSCASMNGLWEGRDRLGLLSDNLSFFQN